MTVGELMKLITWLEAEADRAMQAYQERTTITATTDEKPFKDLYDKGMHIIGLVSVLKGLTVKM